MKIFVNLITTARLFGIVGLTLLKRGISIKTFFIYVIVLLSTDWIDGMLARTFKVQTLFGSVMDALADKIFNICLLLFLISKNHFFFLPLIGELMIASTNIHSFVSGKKTNTNIFGKVKMWLLSFSIILGYIDYFEVASIDMIINAMIIITFVFQVIALAHYIATIRSQEKVERQKIEIHNFHELKYYLFDTDYYLNTK